MRVMEVQVESSVLYRTSASPLWQGVRPSLNIHSPGDTAWPLPPPIVSILSLSRAGKLNTNIGVDPRRIYVIGYHRCVAELITA